MKITPHLPSLAEAMEEVTWDRQQRSRRPIADDRRWWRSLSLILGLPVGKREAGFWRVWVRAGGHEYRRPWQDGVDAREDARPAVELLQNDPNISPPLAAAIYRCAAAHRMWERGYGSPHSPPAPFIRQMLRRGVRPEDIGRVWEMCGWRPGRNPLRRERLLRALYRVRLPLTIDLHRLMVAHIERLGDRFGYRGFLAGLGALTRVQLIVPRQMVYKIDIRPLRELFWRRVQRLLKLPLWKLRHRYASPKKVWALYGVEQKVWELYGIKVGADVRAKPRLGAKSNTIRGLLAHLGQEVLSNEFARYISRVERYFGAHATAWVSAAGGLHDAGVCLPRAKRGKGLREWIAQHAAWVLRHPRIAAEIFRDWTPDLATMTVAEVRAAMKNRRYPRLPAELQDFAADVNLPRTAQGRFARWAKRLVDHPPARECVPPVRVELNGRTLESLPRGDPRGPWLGLATNCCQHPGGAGSTCAKHGALNPNGGFWVVRDDGGRIVAQSWIWRNGDTVVADNIESLSGYHWLRELYVLAARQLCGRLGIVAVHVGENSDVDVTMFNPAKTVSPPTGCYTDAHSQRVLAV